MALQHAQHENGKSKKKATENQKLKTKRNCWQNETRFAAPRLEKPNCNQMRWLELEWELRTGGRWGGSWMDGRMDGHLNWNRSGGKNHTPSVHLLLRPPLPSRASPWAALATAWLPLPSAGMLNATEATKRANHVSPCHGNQSPATLSCTWKK